MKNVIVLGSGCTKCVKTAESIQKIAADLGIECTVTKESSLQTIMSYKVMSTPAVVVDGELVHYGSIPQSDQIKTWLKG